MRFRFERTSASIYSISNEILLEYLLIVGSIENNLGKKTKNNNTTLIFSVIDLERSQFVRV